MASKLKMLRALVVMAASDGTIDESELALLHQTCGAWGLSGEVLQEAIVAVQSGDKRLSIPKDPQGRSDLLRSLVAVAAVDGVIDPKERKMLRAVASKVGLAEPDLEAMLAQALAAGDAERRAAAARPIGVTDSDSDVAPLAFAAKHASSPPSDFPVSPQRALAGLGALVVLSYVVIPVVSGLSAGSKARAEGELKADRRAASYQRNLEHERVELLYGVERKKQEVEKLVHKRQRVKAEIAHAQAAVRRSQRRLEKLKPKQVDLVAARAKLRLRQEALRTKQEAAKEHFERRQQQFRAKFGQGG